MLKYAGVYSVDHETTTLYAAAAARAARVLNAFDRTLAAEYLESARRAWAWVDSHAGSNDEHYRKALSFDKGLPGRLRDRRAMAAVELLAATGDASFDEAFKQSSELVDAPGLYLSQPDADFAYARLPKHLGDPRLKERAHRADHGLRRSCDCV